MNHVYITGVFLGVLSLASLFLSHKSYSTDSTVGYALMSMFYAAAMTVVLLSI